MPVLVEKSGHVTVITMNRPEVRNAVDRSMARALYEAFLEFEGDELAHVAILTGAGGHFSAGADLKAFAKGQGNRVEKEGEAPLGPTRMLLSKPVIAAVSGYAVAGGLELAAWCDLRVASADAKFGVFCRRWGVPLIDGGTVRLPRLIGLSHALDMILTGRQIDGAEAFRMGLVNRLVEQDALGAAVELAAMLARFPQECMRNDRMSAYESSGQSIEDAMEREFELGLKSLAVAGDGVQRFVDGSGRHGSFEE